ncbi:MAG: hypothetical protein ACRDDX_15245 [Cellulosilyticaceae bacterium]
MQGIRIGMILLIVAIIVIIAYLVSIVYFSKGKKWYIGMVLPNLPLFLLPIYIANTVPSDKPLMGDGFIGFLLIVLGVLGWLLFGGTRAIILIIWLMKYRRK